MTSETPPVGTLLQATIGPDRSALARPTPIEAREAAAQALQAYLLCLVFIVPGMPQVRFRLNDVRQDWPENFHELNFPAAAITVGAVINDPHNLTPSALEETWHRFERDTVLWKTAEEQIDFVVDVWTTNKPERVAVRAGLQDAFNPTEIRAGIMVQGPHEYYERTVRLTLQSLEGVDGSDTVFSRERQLRAVVRADIDVVQLRKAGALAPQPLLNGDPIAVGRRA